ncbi:MAG TPA: sugar kinase [Terriglobales bacterium]|nr:sugar kinase [Terriglobales bacterium]
MSNLDICIAGELNFDLILYGLPQQMPAERELLADSFSMTLGSSSAIVAHNLAALGSRVGFITKVGDDALGQMALDQMRAGRVDLSRVVVAKGAGSGITVILPHERERHMFTYLGTISELRYEDIDFAYLTSARHFHLSSLFLQRALAPRVPELFQRLRAAGVTISLDTNDDPDDRWEGLEAILPYVDVLLPNEREAMKMARTDDLETAVAYLSKRVKTVVVKLGSRGAMAIRDGKQFTASAVSVKVVDPVGAGDSFDAGFLHQFLRGSDLQTCLDFGNACGAFSTTAPGGTQAFRNQTAMQAFLGK